MSHNPTENVAEVASHDLFAVGDKVEIIAPGITKGERATVMQNAFGRIEVEFSRGWIGWYLPYQLRKISSANVEPIRSGGGVTPSADRTPESP